MTLHEMFSDIQHEQILLATSVINCLEIYLFYPANPVCNMQQSIYGLLFYLAVHPLIKSPCISDSFPVSSIQKSCIFTYENLTTEAFMASLVQHLQQQTLPQELFSHRHPRRGGRGQIGCAAAPSRRNRHLLLQIWNKSIKNGVMHYLTGIIIINIMQCGGMWTTFA